MKRSLLGLVTIISLLFLSCGSEESSRRILPESTGRHSEILVVCDSLEWENGIGKELQAIYERDYPLLLKTEPFFNIIRIQKEHFSRILKTHQNILIVSKTDSIQKIKTYDELWAQDQKLMQIRFKNRPEMADQIQKASKTLFNYFYEADLERISKENSVKMLEGVKDLFESNNNLRVVIPGDFRLVSDSADFYWFKRDKPHVIESITIYEEDYISEDQYKIEQILDRRDTLCRAHLPGGRENSYMTTEYYIPPVSDTIDVNGTFGIRTRGWWKLVNDFMGGYFIRYSFADPNRGKMIYVEAFLYCPKYDKMFYLRELEAILHSIEVIKK
ncbi:MAG: DUF4837 family protein [Flavobacteriales bacterium]|jgi:hypothetical protein|nr:DUF4837 family protein [Flavobacteriales bacterium]